MEYWKNALIETLTPLPHSPQEAYDLKLHHGQKKTRENGEITILAKVNTFRVGDTVICDFFELRKGLNFREYIYNDLSWLMLIPQPMD